MYGYLSLFLILPTMICCTTSNGDVYNRPVQRRSEADFAPNFHETRDVFPPAPERRHVPYNKDFNSHIDPVRHTHTSTKVDLSQHEELQVRPTTVRNYIKPESINMRNQFNTSESPDLSSRSGNKRKSQAYEDQTRMLYPSEFENLTRAVPSQINSKNCSFGFCDEVEDYPSDRIQKIISRSTELKQFFTKDILTVPTFESRFGVDGETLCSTTTHTRFPKTAVNMQNIEQLLVNVDNYKQGVVYETCKTDGGPCNYVENIPNNYVTTCHQKYTVRKLMVLGKESDKPIFDDFKIPSCCVCTVKEN